VLYRQSLDFGSKFCTRYLVALLAFGQGFSIDFREWILLKKCLILADNFRQAGLNINGFNFTELLANIP
jgi:hypothetical protein